MLKNLSSNDVDWILSQIGITLKRRSKEDVYSGEYQGKNRIDKDRLTACLMIFFLPTSSEDQS